MFEIVGLILSIQHYKFKVFQFFTEISNYLALIISLIFCLISALSLKKSCQIPKWVHFLRYTATVCLSLTFIVILCVLSPLYPDKFVYWMFTGSGIFHHTLCPLLSIISFVFFENYHQLKKKSIFLSLTPSLIYGIICILLNILEALTGPYPFFYVRELPLYVSIPSLLGVVLCTLAISFALYKINNKRSREV